MAKYVAFLRGINVGGKNVIKMEALREAFVKMGFSSVTSYIQSGNVIFETDISDKLEIEKKVESSLKERFKYDARVIVRSSEDMENTVKNIPAIFQNPEWKHNVIFLGDTLDSPEVLKKFELKEGIEETNYVKGVLFWSAEMKSIGRSTMLKLSTKKEYKEMTVRNVNTTRKILELMSGNN
jgi:uncharacterized protein (DUF1697 family)